MYLLAYLWYAVTKTSSFHTILYTGDYSFISIGLSFTLVPAVTTQAHTAVRLLSIDQQLRNVEHSSGTTWAGYKYCANELKIISFLLLSTCTYLTNDVPLFSSSPIQIICSARFHFCLGHIHPHMLATYISSMVCTSHLSQGLAIPGLELSFSFSFPSITFASKTFPHSHPKITGTIHQVLSLFETVLLYIFYDRGPSFLPCKQC